MDEWKRTIPSILLVLALVNVTTWYVTMPSNDVLPDRPPPRRPAHQVHTNTNSTSLMRAEFVSSMALSAWKAYMKFAKGADELKPVSNGSDFGRWGRTRPTPFDAVTTMLLMGHRDAYHEAKLLALSTSFDSFNRLSVFELTIRHLGASLSAYSLTEDSDFLRKAQEIARRLMPAFQARAPTKDASGSGDENESIGLPGTFITLNDGTSTFNNGHATLAEVGSMQMEFRYLSALTGDDSYATEVNKFTQHLFSCLDAGWPENEDLYLPGSPLMPHRGLWPMTIDPSTGRWSGAAAVGSMSDSFYEYLLKQWILFGKRPDDRILVLYEDAVEGILTHLLKYTSGHWAFVGHVGFGFEPTQDHLSCFIAGTLALGVMTNAHATTSKRTRWWSGEDVAAAAIDLAAGCFHLYVESHSGIGPEVVSFSPEENTAEVKDSKYILRPELIESLFYLYRLTRDDRYRDWGWKIVTSIDRHCRTPNGGYSGLLSVMEPNKWDDVMESFFFAETLKYAYLLFSDANVIPLDAYVFNTEGHPFKVLST